jgi:Co/Zn/Cd efflux system component
MAREQGGDKAAVPVAAGGVTRGSREPLMPVPLLRGPAASESLITVLVAFGANLLIAVAKSAAAVVTGSAVPDATGSILVGLLLGAVAVVLINRNLRFLVGEEADPRIRSAILRALLAMPEVARVTYLRLEVIGPRMVFVTGDVDLTGDDSESHVAVRLRALEAKFCTSSAVGGAVLSLSAPDEPALQA